MDDFRMNRRPKKEQSPDQMMAMAQHLAALTEVLTEREAAVQEPPAT